MTNYQLKDGASPVVSVANLQRMLGGLTVLNDLNTSLNAGDVVGLLGKNGAGKTTLLETLLGFGLPAFGELKLWGEAAHKISGETKQRIGFVPQQDELLLMMTGEDHLRLYRSLRAKWNQPLVDKLCQEWDIPLTRMARKMSVGQRQKLSIVLALAHEPDLLVLDEPVASLDPFARRQFLQEIVDAAVDYNPTIIFSSHIVSDMERIANRIWLLDEGRLVCDETLDYLKESVVRVSLNLAAPLVKMPEIAGILRYEAASYGAWMICRDWADTKKLQLEAATGAGIQVDYLGLEDIFLHLSLRVK